MIDLKPQLEQCLHLNLNSNQNKFRKARLSVRQIGFQRTQKNWLNKKKFNHFQRKSVPNLPSYKRSIQKDLLYPVQLREKKDKNGIILIERNLTPNLKVYQQQFIQKNQFNKRLSVQKAGIFPSLNSIKMDPCELLDIAQNKQTKYFDIQPKKSNILHKKSQKYIIQCQKLRQRKASKHSQNNNQKIFFISNLILDNFNQPNKSKIKTIQSKTLIKLKQLQKQKRIKNLISTKLIQKSPFELKTGKIKQQKKQFNIVNRYEYNDNLRQKLDKIKQQKIKQKRMNFEMGKINNNQEIVDGWNQNQQNKINIYNFDYHKNN